MSTTAKNDPPVAQNQVNSTNLPQNTNPSHNQPTNTTPVEPKVKGKDLFRKSPLEARLKNIKAFRNSTLGDGHVLEDAETKKILFSKEVTYTGEKDFISAVAQAQKQVKIRDAGLLNLLDYSADQITNFCSSFYRLKLYYESSANDLTREIRERAKRSGNFNEEEMTFMLYHLTSGLSKLHQEKIYHDEISPDFVDLTNQNARNYKLVKPTTEANSNFRQSSYNNIFRGKPLYMAPEVFNNTSNLTKRDVPLNFDQEKTDSFSLGMTLLNAGLMDSVQNCYDSKAYKFDERALNGNIERFTNKYKDNPMLWESIKRLLDPNPQTRCSAIELISDMPPHAEINDYFDIKDQKDMDSGLVMSNLYPPNLKDVKSVPIDQSQPSKIVNSGILDTPTHKTGPVIAKHDVLNKDSTQSIPTQSSNRITPSFAPADEKNVRSSPNPYINQDGSQNISQNAFAPLGRVLNTNVSQNPPNFAPANGRTVQSSAPVKRSASQPNQIGTPVGGPTYVRASPKVIPQVTRYADNRYAPIRTVTQSHGLLPQDYPRTTIRYPAGAPIMRGNAYPYAGNIGQYTGNITRTYTHAGPVRTSHHPYYPGEQIIDPRISNGIRRSEYVYPTAPRITGSSNAEPFGDSRGMRSYSTSVRDAPTEAPSGERIVISKNKIETFTEEPRRTSTAYTNPIGSSIYRPPHELSARAYPPTSIAYQPIRSYMNGPFPGHVTSNPFRKEKLVESNLPSPRPFASNFDTSGSYQPKIYNSIADYNRGKNFQLQNSTAPNIEESKVEKVVKND